MKTMMNRIPIPMSGLMLALAVTGNLVYSYGSIYKYAFGVLSAVLLILLLTKMRMNPKTILEELENPVSAGVLATFPMGIMVLSTYIKPVVPLFAYCIWLSAIVMHCALIIYYTKKYLIGFDIKKVFTSYFVVYVGIVVVSVTAPAYNQLAIGKAAFCVGFVCYIVLLPIILYRIFRVKAIAEPIIPTLTIFAAPASLCLVGYLNTFEQKNEFIIMLLLILSIVMYMGVFFYMPKMLKLKFYPSYSALTFPCVISAMATKAANIYLKGIGFETANLNLLARFQEAIAVILVLYVLWRYTKHLVFDQKIHKK